MRSLVAVLVLTATVAACSGSGTTTTTPATTSSVPPTAPPTTSVAPPTTQPAATSPCLEGDRPFATGGVISAFGGATGDAAQISGIRAAGHPGCERVVVDLLTVDGAPAGSVGLTGVEYDEVVGVVRVNLPKAITRTALTDLLLDGDLISRAFVVRTGDGHLAIDIHVAAGAGVALRAFEVDAPSRIVVDVRPDDEAPVVRGATFGEDVVVIEPAPGATLTPLQVSGYARAFEANVTARVHDDQTGDALAEATTTATDWVDAWGEFTMVLEDPPARPLQLFVGSDSPSDGSPIGVWMSVDLSSTAVPAPTDG